MSKITDHNHSKLWVLVLGVLLFPCALLSLAQDPPEKPEVVAEQKNVLAELQKSLIKAFGGKEALEKFNNRRVLATIVIPDAAIEAKHVGFVAKDGTMRESMTIEGYGDFEQGVLGDVAWAQDPINGARILAGREKQQLLRSSHLQPLLWLDKDFVSAVKIGTEKVGAVDCDIYSLQSTMGTTEKYWVALETDFLIKIAMTAESIMGKVPMTVRMGDYKQFQGIWYPHDLEIVQGIQTMQMTINEVKYDVEPESVEQTIPDQVNAILERKKAAEKKVEEKAGEKVEDASAGGR
ncbi:MAG: hypothetical protein AAEJ04_11665 [Planctomycetota bacterium]